MESMGPSSSPHLRWSGSIPLEYRYTSGVAGAKFLGSLKEKGKLVGSKCSRCSDRRVPARLYCVNCYSEIDHYEELEGSWEVHSFAIKRADSGDVIYALLKFPGWGGGLIHKIIGVRAHNVKTGMKVKPVVKSNRRGSILDIEGFMPVRRS